MAYTPTQWKDRVVEKPRTYRMQDNGDGTITLIPAPGTIYEPGTPVNAPNMNHIEKGIEEAHMLAEGAVSKSGDTMTGQLIVPRVFVSASDGVEGGEMELAKPASGTSLAGNVAIDIYGNYIRFFEQGGDFRGARINLTEQANGVGSDIWTTAKLRINNGTLEFFDGGVWKPVGFDPRTMELNSFNHFADQIIVGAKSYSDILTVNGKGVLSEFVIYVFAPSNNEKLGVSLVTDGNEVPLYIYDNIRNSAVTPVVAGLDRFGQTNSVQARIVEFNSLAAYESSLIIRLRNESESSVGGVQVILRGVYYT